jgi:hypothetical protein
VDKRLISFLAASGSIDKAGTKSCFAFGAETKTLIFGTTTNFVRHSISSFVQENSLRLILKKLEKNF